MQAKDFMLQVRRAEQELLAISAKRRHYTDLMLSIGAKISSTVVSKSGNSSKTETAAIGIWEMTKALDEKEKEYVRIVKQAEEKIAKLSQEKFRQILTLKYLCGWSWKSIRDELGYNDEKSVYRCHGYALRELQKFL